MSVLPSRLAAGALLFAIAGCSEPSPDAAKAVAIDILTQAADTGLEVAWAPDIAVKRSSGAFEVTFQGVTAKSNVLTLDLGTLTMTIEDPKHGSDGDSNHVAIKLQPDLTATLISAGAASGGPIKLHIDRNDTVGTWLQPIKHFSEIHTILGSATIGVDGAPNHGRIGSADFTASGTDKNGLWTGKNSYVVRDVAIDSEHGHLTIAEIDNTGTVSNFAAKPWMQASRQIGPILSAKSAGAQGADEAKQIAAALKDLPRMADSFGSEIRLKGISSGDGNPAPFKLDELGVDVSFMHGTGAVSDLALGLSMQGLGVTLPDGLETLRPALAKLKITLKDVPTDEVWAEALRSMETAPAGTADPMATFLGLARKAAKQVLIDLALSTQAAKLAGTGEVVADPSAAYSARASAKIGIEGLDETIAALSQASGAQARQAAAGLMLVKRVGAIRPSANPAAYDYVLELTPAGDATVNGRPWQTLLK
jgi:hypothetical protein